MSLDATNFRILLDVPAEQPALQYGHYAAAFAQIIMQSSPRFAIGVFGGWGSGKTTLMKAIESQLDQTQCVSVWFSAWRYEKEEHLIIPLLDTLRETLDEWGQQYNKPEAGKTAATIGKVLYSLVAGFSLKVGLPGALDLSFDANKALGEADKIAKAEEAAKVPRSFYHAAFRALEKSFADFVKDDPARRIVVFVDDLDRCLPESAREVLESMKLFFDLAGFVFVVGLDQKVVELAIESKYAQETATLPSDEREAYRIRGADYIKKIFQVPFSLRPVPVTEIDSFLNSICQEAQLPLDQENDLRNSVRYHLDYLVGDSGMNPREIKRYINAYTLLLKMMPHLEAPVVLTMQTIQFRTDWELVWRKLLAYRQLFIEALQQRIEQNDQQALENLDLELAAIPTQFLEYVSTPPGRALITVDTIDAYIYAGEVARSEGDLGLSDLVRDVTRLRRLLRDVHNLDRNAPPVITARSHISMLRSNIASRASTPGTFSQAVLQRLDVIDNSLEQLPLEGERWTTWLSSNDRQVDQAVAEIFQWSRRFGRA